MDNEKTAENEQYTKDPEYFDETSASERENHRKLMQECERGEVLLGVDTIISRKFFTELSTTEIRNAIKQEASLAKWVVTVIYCLSNVNIFLILPILSIFVFGWWSPFAIVGIFAIWGISKSTAVIGHHPAGILPARSPTIRRHQRISPSNRFWLRFLCLVIGVMIAIYLQRGWAFNAWVTLVSSIPLIEKLLYFFSKMFLEAIIMNNAIAWRLFNGKGAKVVPKSK